MSIDWTPSQQAGFKTFGTSVLLSAAAGSGKTAVLSKRCEFAVCDLDPPCDVDQLLVVTFTRAAAAEMRQRIAETIRTRLSNSPQDSRFREQLRLIDRASITTIDAFCAQLVRRNFHLLGIDPAVQTMDAQEAMLLRKQIMREVIDDAFESPDQESLETFHRLVDLYGDGRDVEIINHVQRISLMLDTEPDEAAWMSRAIHHIEESAGGEFWDHLGQDLAVWAHARVGEFVDEVCDVQRQWNLERPGHKYSGFLSDLLGRLLDVSQRFHAGDNHAAFNALRDVWPEKTPQIRDKTDSLEALRTRIVSLKSTLGRSPWDLLTSTTPQQWIEDLKAIFPPMKALLELVRRFRAAYALAKEQLRVLDFADFSRMALRLLEDEDGQPTPVAFGCHRQFAYVLVDEFQDINPLQNRLLQLVSRECVDGQGKGNLFAVGDLKQSIYRFRAADPGLIRERGRKFDLPGSGTVIHLQETFRCRPALVSALNDIFHPLMHEDSAGFDYADRHALQRGGDYPPTPEIAFVGSPVELHVIVPAQERQVSENHDDGVDEQAQTEVAADEDDQDLEIEEREASLIATQVLEMVGAAGKPARQVYDKKCGAYRSARFSDVAVLMRTKRIVAERIARTLRGRGVPAYTEPTGGFLTAMEVRDVLNLLSVIDNRRQDLPLACVLRSPLFESNARDDDLARIRLAFNDKTPFADAALRYAAGQTDDLSKRLRALLTRVDRWREIARRRPIAEVLQRIYQDTGYVAYVSGLEDGRQREANLLHLVSLARQFAAQQRQSVSRFIRYLQLLADDDSLGQPSVASAADNAVQVMTVHASKGLEFPIVFLTLAGRQFNQSSTYGGVLVDRHTGLALERRDDTRMTRWETVPTILTRYHIAQQEMQESMRLLYVAMTRAREHLVIVGTARDEVKEIATLEGRLPTPVVRKGKSFLDWLLPLTTSVASLQLNLVPADKVQTRTARSEAFEALPAPQPMNPPPPPDAAADDAIDALHFAYPHAQATIEEASISVTALIKPQDRPDAARATPTPIDLTQPHIAGVENLHTADGLEIGDATHLVMQWIDLASPQTLDAQIEAMVSRQILSTQQAGLVSTDDIAWFCQTPLGRQFAQHGSSLRKELPVHFAHGQGDDAQMIRGRIDVLLEQDDGLVIADYKTDRTTVNRIDPYSAQLSMYAQALSAMSGKPVTGRHLVFLRARQIHDV